MTHFSFAQVVKGALTGQKKWTPQWPDRAPKDAYDVVIVGAGGHRLGAAYYLAKEHGITNVAVIDKGWLGGGNTGATPGSSARTTSTTRAPDFTTMRSTFGRAFPRS